MFMGRRDSRKEAEKRDGVAVVRCTMLICEVMETTIVRVYQDEYSKTICYSMDDVDYRSHGCLV